jgi:hypothetical protein
MRAALVLVGGFLLLVGGFFAAQGLGVIPWPAESFMVGNKDWAYYGSGIALAGATFLFVARK